MCDGMLPIPEVAGGLVCSPGGLVGVSYVAEFRCLRCYWKPFNPFSAVSEMQSHLREAHAWNGHPVWIACYSDSIVKHALAAYEEGHRTNIDLVAAKAGNDIVRDLLRRVFAKMDAGEPHFDELAILRKLTCNQGDSKTPQSTG